MEDGLRTVLVGLADGSVYALIALAMSVIWRATNMLDLATAEYFMLAGFLGIAGIATFGVGILGALLIALAVCMAIAALAYVGFMRPASRFGGDIYILTTLGIAIVLQEAAAQIWGTLPVKFPEIVPNIQFGVLEIRWLPVIGASVIVTFGIAIIYRRTLVGRALQATAQDPEAARALGIRPRRMGVIAFAVGASIAVIAGLLAAPWQFVYFYSGAVLGLKGFIALAIGGGMRSPYGALIGGLILGVAESGSVAIAGAGYRDAIAFLLFIVVLAVRPTGIFGGRNERVV